MNKNQSWELAEGSKSSRFIKENLQKERRLGVFLKKNDSLYQLSGPFGHLIVASQQHWGDFGVCQVSGL